MSETSGQLLGSYIKLTQMNASQWKDAVIDKALIIDAYQILMGTETLSSISADPTLLASYRTHASRLARNISSTLNEVHHALIKNVSPKIVPDDAHGIMNLSSAILNLKPQTLVSLQPRR